MDVNNDSHMATSLPKAPKKAEKRNLTVQIDRELFDKAATQVRVQGITIRQAIQWGLEQFVDACQKQKRTKANG